MVVFSFSGIISVTSVRGKIDTHTHTHTLMNRFSAMLRTSDTTWTSVCAFFGAHKLYAIDSEKYLKKKCPAHKSVAEFTEFIEGKTKLHTHTHAKIYSSADSHTHSVCCERIALCMLICYATAKSLNFQCES